MTGILHYPIDEPKRAPISRKPANSCLRRESSLTYKLVNPLDPDSEDALYYDVGQLKQILLMDQRLREEGVVRSIPAGYLEFATRFNAYAEGPERFATYHFTKGQYTIATSGRPMTWECLALDSPLPEPSKTHRYPGAADHLEGGSMPVFGFMDGSTNTQLHALSVYMCGVMNTTDELTRFWIKRSAIEQQYATRLADLAETPIGKNDLPEIRSAMDSLRMETAKQAMNRFELAKQIVTELEKRCVDLQVKQRRHWRDTYEPAARKIHQSARVHEKRRRSANIANEWKQEYKKLRYSLDHHRLESLKASFIPFNDTPTTSEWSQSEMSASESWTPPASGPSEWETLRESCAQLEKDRAQRVKEMLSAFSQTLVVISDTDSESAVIAQRSTDLLNPSNMLEEFDQKFGAVERYVVVETASSGKEVQFEDITPTSVPARRALPQVPSKPKRQASTRSTHSQSRSQAVKEVYFQTHNTSALPYQTTKHSPQKSIALLPLPGSLNCRLPQAPILGSSRALHKTRPTLPKLTTNFPNSRVYT